MQRRTRIHAPPYCADTTRIDAMDTTERSTTFITRWPLVACLALVVVFGTSLSDPGNAFALVGDANTPHDFDLPPGRQMLLHPHHLRGHQLLLLVGQRSQGYLDPGKECGLDRTPVGGEHDNGRQLDRIVTEMEKLSLRMTERLLRQLVPA